MILADYAEAKSDRVMNICKGLIASGAFRDAAGNIQALGDVSPSFLPDQNMETGLIQDICQRVRHLVLSPSNASRLDCLSASTGPNSNDNNPTHLLARLVQLAHRLVLNLFMLYNDLKL